MDSKDTEKRRILEELLKFGSVFLVVDRGAGAVAPEGAGLLSSQLVPLNVSYRFCKPMDVDDNGVTALLRFSGVDHEVVIPWRSILRMRSNVQEEQDYIFDVDGNILMRPDSDPVISKPKLRLVC